MTIAAIMPTRNQAEFLEEAIASVAPQVQALVVVDDASTDTTAAILDGREDVDVLTHSANTGTAAAINTGAAYLDKHYPGVQWRSWVSSDNVHYPDWAETLLDAAGDDVGAVYSGYDARGIVEPHYNFTPYDPEWLGRSHACYIGPSFIVRADVWQPHEGRAAHDYANWLLVEEECWRRGLRIVGVDKALCMYRTHARQVTRNKRPGDHDAPKWLAEAKARRKRLGLVPPQIA